MDANQLLQGGTAAAVIAVVLIFLRYLESQRKVQREYHRENEQAWRDRLDESLEGHRETLRLTQLTHERAETMFAQSLMDQKDQNTLEHQAMIRTLERLNGTNEEGN